MIAAAMRQTVAVTSYSSTPTVYSYSIVTGTGTGTGSGFDGSGNIAAYHEIVNGGSEQDWTLGYDALNRLMWADGPSGFNSSKPYFCWTYDAFGNRTLQASEPTGPFTVVSTVGSQSCTQYSSVTATTNTQGYDTGGHNQLVSATLPSTTFSYDYAGNITADSANGYVYDAEGRLCAEATPRRGIWAISITRRVFAWPRERTPA